jgi:hypothetical protein
VTYWVSAVDDNVILAGVAHRHSPIRNHPNNADVISNEVLHHWVVGVDQSRIVFAEHDA